MWNIDYHGGFFIFFNKISKKEGILLKKNQKMTIQYSKISCYNDNHTKITCNRKCSDWRSFATDILTEKGKFVLVGFQNHEEQKKNNQDKDKWNIKKSGKETYVPNSTLMTSLTSELRLSTYFRLYYKSLIDLCGKIKKSNMVLTTLLVKIFPIFFKTILMDKILYNMMVV